MTHGGKRKNAGRPKRFGDMKTIAYRRTVPKEWVKVMDNYLERLRLAKNVDKP